MLRSKLSVGQSLSSRLERIEDALAKTLAQHDNATTSSNTSTPSTSTPITSIPTIRTCECAHDTTESPSEQPGGPPEQRQNPVSLGEQFAAYDLTQSPFISTPSSNFTTSASFGHIHYGGCHLGQIRSHNGMPILSEEGCKWVQQKTGEDVSFSKFHVRFQKQALPPTLSPWHFFRSKNELHELPDKRIVEQVLDVFINSAFRLVFPVIDRVLFEETVILAYEECDGPLSLERISAKGCVLAFVSVMCLFQGQDANIPAVDSDTCAVKAHYLLSDVFEDSSIVSLQTVFMLVSAPRLRQITFDLDPWLISSPAHASDVFGPATVRSYAACHCLSHCVHARRAHVQAYKVIWRRSNAQRAKGTPIAHALLALLHFR